MELEYKPDFEAARMRWTDYWQGRSDRPVVQILAPRPGIEPKPKPHPYEIHEVGAEGYADLVEAWADSTLFLGDAMPYCQISYCADHMALLMGADMELSGSMGSGQARSGWVHSFLDDYEAELALRPECRWFERTFEDIETLRRRFEGRILIAMTEMAGGLDTLAAVRGTENLLTDILICPDEVTRAVERIDVLQNEALELAAQAIGFDTWGCITRHGTYAPHRTSVPQCDFSFMIGVEAFRQFQLPSLQRECQAYDGAVYHLDGPASIKHLEAVCEVDKIKAIQWVPGAGEAQSQDWSELYARVDALGRGNFLGGRREHIERYARQYQSDYGCYRVHCDITPEEAEDFLAGLSRGA